MLIPGQRCIRHVERNKTACTNQLRMRLLAHVKWVERLMRLTANLSDFKRRIHKIRKHITNWAQKNHRSVIIVTTHHQITICVMVGSFGKNSTMTQIILRSPGKWFLCTWWCYQHYSLNHEIIVFDWIWYALESETIGDAVCSRAYSGKFNLLETIIFAENIHEKKSFKRLLRRVQNGRSLGGFTCISMEVL